MLEAKKSVWFERIFSIYNRNLLKRRFDSLRVSGLDFLKNKDAKIPLVIYANHSSWWDGLIFWEIIVNLDFEFYVMMEEKQLRQLFLFRRLGAFSVVREKPREAVKSINYAAALLRKDANRSVIIFPQGEILPNDVRPLHFFRGLASIVEKTVRCSVVPIALRYEFAKNFKPEILCKIGAPDVFEAGENFDSKNLNGILEARLTATLDSLKRDVVSGTTAGYENLF